MFVQPVEELTQQQEATRPLALDQERDGLARAAACGDLVEQRAGHADRGVHIAPCPGDLLSGPSRLFGPSWFGTAAHGVAPGAPEFRQQPCARVRGRKATQIGDTHGREVQDIALDMVGGAVGGYRLVQGALPLRERWHTMPPFPPS
ncbi:hypothetical protein OG413_33530 [Streptomyces sp. NBC_01433]|uniref:hypothetical protein n=1 Tax=Streptomyces sp. NBC_01433 TaxID=2903864 RepID=UPI0022546B0E|nr:hypothetical protein [Streptomyces sp. NBC_01433]MCX4680143.1 hypothetical protein [Streptomyces sp. NBC_01433]